MRKISAEIIAVLGLWSRGEQSMEDRATKMYVNKLSFHIFSVERVYTLGGIRKYRLILTYTHSFPLTLFSVWLLCTSTLSFQQSYYTISYEVIKATSIKRNLARDPASQPRLSPWPRKHCKCLSWSNYDMQPVFLLSSCRPPLHHCLPNPLQQVESTARAPCCP